MLIGGTFLAQLIPILLQPILRRMFTPEEFGIMAVYFSIVSIVCVFVNLNYQAAVVLPEDEKDSMALVLGSLVISSVISLFFGLILVLFSDLFLAFFKFPSGLKPWLILLPISIFLNSAHLIFSGWLTRKKAFRAFALNKVSRRMAEGVGQLSLGVKWHSAGLIVGTFIGDLVNGITYWVQYIKTGGTFSKEIRQRIKGNLKRYKHFPLVSLMPNLLSTISLFIPVLLITSLYSADVTGQFDLSRQILALPLSLISVSISQVLLQKLTESRMKKESVMAQMKKLFLILVAISLLTCIVTTFVGEELFTWIFGEEWRFSGEITVLLIWSYGIKFVISPLSITFIAFEKLTLNSIWQIGYFFAMLLLYTIPKMPFKDFLYLLVAIDSVFYVVYGILTYVVLTNYEKRLD
jgi:O-antigen/teichoic acid export membrane protein